MVFPNTRQRMQTTIAAALTLLLLQAAVLQHVGAQVSPSACPVAQVALGNTHTCGVLEGGSVKCWGGAAGDGATGTLDGGLGDSPSEMGAALPALNLEGRTAAKLAAGFGHSCALLDNGRVQCWGNNLANVSQLGLALGLDQTDALPQGGIVDLGTGGSGSPLLAIDISVGQDFSCALLEGGAVKCWGDNQWGQLGQGDSEPRGGAVDSMGNNLAPIDLGSGLTVKQVTCGSGHACALMSNNRVKCWGNNDEGQLGLGDIQGRGGEPGQMGDTLQFVELPGDGTATQLVAGRFHTCAVLTDGRVMCWGDNTSGALGIALTTDQVGGRPGTMGNAMQAAFTPSSSLQLVSIASGQNHVCAVVSQQPDSGSNSSNIVKCWGDNQRGKLGVGRGDGGTFVTPFDPSWPAVNISSTDPPVSIWSGPTADAACVLLQSGFIRCWGANDFGQLGTGDQIFRGATLQDMQNLKNVQLCTPPPPAPPAPPTNPTPVVVVMAMDFSNIAQADTNAGFQSQLINRLATTFRLPPSGVTIQSLSPGSAVANVELALPANPPVPLTPYLNDKTRAANALGQQFMGSYGITSALILTPQQYQQGLAAAIVNPTTPPSSGSSGDKGGGVPIGAVAGGAAGGVVLLLAIAAFILWRRRRRTVSQPTSKEAPPQQVVVRVDPAVPPRPTSVEQQPAGPEIQPVVSLSTPMEAPGPGTPAPATPDTTHYSVDVAEDYTPPPRVPSTDGVAHMEQQQQQNPLRPTEQQRLEALAAARANVSVIYKADPPPEPTPPEFPALRPTGRREGLGSSPSVETSAPPETVMLRHVDPNAQGSNVPSGPSLEPVNLRHVDPNARPAPTTNKPQINANLRHTGRTYQGPGFVDPTGQGQSQLLHEQLPDVPEAQVAAVPLPATFSPEYVRSWLNMASLRRMMSVMGGGDGSAQAAPEPPVLSPGAQEAARLAALARQQATGSRRPSQEEAQLQQQQQQQQQ